MNWSAALNIPVWLNPKKIFQNKSFFVICLLMMFLLSFKVKNRTKSQREWENMYFLFLNQNNKHRSLKEYWRNKGWNDFSFCIITAPVNGKEYELHLFKHLFHYLTFNYHSTLLIFLMVKGLLLDTRMVITVVRIKKNWRPPKSHPLGWQLVWN